MYGPSRRSPPRMEESNSFKMRNDAHCSNVGGDDYELMQVFAGKREDSMSEELLCGSSLVKNEFIKSESHHYVENFNSFIPGNGRECVKNEEQRQIDLSQNSQCRNRYLYKEMLVSFAELQQCESVGVNNAVDDILQLNDKIANNIAQCRDLTIETESILIELITLRRELEVMYQRINSCTPECLELNQSAQRKKDLNCTSTGRCRRTTSFYCQFGMPYFKTTDRYTPGPNEDMRQIVKRNDIMMIRLPRVKKIKSSDRDKIEAAVLEQLKTKRVRQLRAMIAADRSQGPDILEEIKHVQSVQHVREATSWNIPIDFSTLFPRAENQLDFRFSGEECERIWLLVGDPRISKEGFSSDEVSMLRQLTRKYGAQDWDRIADQLGTGRSGFICFMEWARMREKFRNHAWTKEETEKLFNCCRKLEHVADPAVISQMWRHIRHEFPHRTYSQLSARWMYALKPSLKKGRFTEKESNILHQLKDEGKSYPEIASVIRTRSTVQLRTHFDAISSHAIYNKGPWSDKEEAKLHSLVRKYGAGNWKKISRELGTRSRTQCRLKSLSRTRTWSSVEKRKYWQLIEEYGTDFERISQEMGTKTVGQCRYMYRCTPVPKTGRWKKTETALFHSLLGRWKNDFDMISKELKTRSASQCRRMYQKLITRGQITANECLPNDCGNLQPSSSCGSLTKPTNNNSCGLISREMEARNVDQRLEKRRNKITKPKDVGGMKSAQTRPSRWSRRETNSFHVLVGRFKCDFNAISRELKTKNADQCRRKYIRIMRQKNPESPRTSRWSRKEVELFRVLVDLRKCNFVAISREMGTRTAGQCCSKYRKMVKRQQLNVEDVHTRASVRDQSPTNEEISCRNLKPKNGQKSLS